MKTATKWLAMAALCAGAVVMADGARAQTYGDNYPVCLQIFGLFQHYECQYTSIPQCKAVASGRPAECVVNPFFVAPPPGPAPRRKRHR